MDVTVQSHRLESTYFTKCMDAFFLYNMLWLSAEPGRRSRRARHYHSHLNYHIFPIHMKKILSVPLTSLLLAAPSPRCAAVCTGAFQPPLRSVSVTSLEFERMFDNAVLLHAWWCSISTCTLSAGNCSIQFSKSLLAGIFFSFIPSSLFLFALATSLATSASGSFKGLFELALVRSIPTAAFLSMLEDNKNRITRDTKTSGKLFGFLVFIAHHLSGLDVFRKFQCQFFVQRRNALAGPTPSRHEFHNYCRVVFATSVEHSR